MSYAEQCPPWVKRKINDFFEHRRLNPHRKDKHFKTPNTRDRHVVKSTAELDRYCQKHLRAADRVEKGQRYFIVMDVEAAISPKSYWHEKELKMKGVSEEEIGERRQALSRLRGSSDWNVPKYYWENRQEEKVSGIIEGSVAAIQISAVSDKSGDDTFVVNCLSLAGDTNDGLPETFHRQQHSSLSRLRRHPTRPAGGRRRCPYFGARISRIRRISVSVQRPIHRMHHRQSQTPRRRNLHRKRVYTPSIILHSNVLRLSPSSPQRRHRHRWRH